MNKVILGNNGFDKESVNYFIITYNISAFDYSGERSQGLFNAGLAAMQFVNGLHLRGIGSCFMEWSNKRKEDKIVRKRLKLEESERIAVVIAYTGACRTVKPEYAAHLHRSMSHTQTGISRTLL